MGWRDKSSISSLLQWSRIDAGWLREVQELKKYLELGKINRAWWQI